MARIQKYLGAGFGKTTMPGLTSTYQGPAKVRASGKAYGKKKPKKAKGKDKAKAKKPAKSGPRPSRPSAPTEDRDGGYKPMKRKKPAAE